MLHVIEKYKYPMLRNIFNVVEQMIETIPKNDPTSHPFLSDLRSYLNNLAFVPPEKMYDILQFNRVMMILITHLGKTPPTEGWQKDVYEIWMNIK